VSTAFITFGCRLNTAETEIMRGHAERAGLDHAVIINSCAVTAEATRQARQAIRKARREHPEAKIIVTGCAAQTDTSMFEAMTEVDVILGNDEKLRAESWTLAGPRARVSDIMAVRGNAPPAIERLTARTRAFLQVQNGCDHRCTFCIIPFGRGNSRSVAADEAVAQAKTLTEAGYAELVLSGVDLTSWGADLQGAPKLGALVRRLLAEVPGLRRLRLSSIDSIEADPELVAIMGGEERVMPHLHLSLQAGDDLILKRMKRRHSRQQAVDFCGALRARRPDMQFGADLIAGFPTETAAMHDNSLRLIDDCGLTYTHIFPFSPRPGTPAALMPQVAKAEIKARAATLRAAGERRLAAFLASEVGATRDILVETEAMGRTAHFAMVKFAERMRPGSVVTARLLSATPTHLEARLAA